MLHRSHARPANDPRRKAADALFYVMSLQFPQISWFGLCDPQVSLYTMRCMHAVSERPCVGLCELAAVCKSVCACMLGCL